jgi:hypothetical protein
MLGPDADGALVRDQLRRPSEVPMVRKISLILVIVAGAFWVAGALAADYPKKTQAVDNLTNSFRPYFTDPALAQSAADLRTSKAFADDFRTKAAPALAQQLKVTPDQFVAGIAQQYPDVGKGLTQLPQILSYFTTVQTTMAGQQHNFHQADAIPTKNLPNTTVTWLFVIPGITAMALGVAGFFFWRRIIPALAALLGLGVILTTLVISTPTKTRAADRLNDAVRPLFTTQSATLARGYVTTLQAMDKQLTGQAIPGLADQLHVTPQQLTGTLATNFPTVATGLQQLPAILGRIDGLVTAVNGNVHNFALGDALPTKDLATTNVEWQFVIPGVVLALAGAAGAVFGLRRRTDDVPASFPGAVASA